MIEIIIAIISFSSGVTLGYILKEIDIATVNPRNKGAELFNGAVGAPYAIGDLPSPPPTKRARLSKGGRE